MPNLSTSEYNALMLARATPPTRKVVAARPRGKGKIGMRKSASARERCCWVNTVKFGSVTEHLEGRDIHYFTLPIYTRSEGNNDVHWRLKGERTNRQIDIVKTNIWPRDVPGPCAVHLVRMAPGTLDAHDNLPGSMKHIVDAIADIAGVDDGDPRWTFTYGQEKSKQYGVKIKISPPP